MTFWDVFASVALRDGDRIAIEVQRSASLDTWSYGELHEAARRHAAWLAAQGVAAGDRCAILADNDAQWCAAYLGILCCGAIAVPLDTNSTASQIATIVADAQPRVLFVNERLHAVAQAAVSSATVVIALTGLVPSVADPVPAPATAAASPALILYTSGTTADPKGVVLSHGNLLAQRDAAFSALDVSPEDSVLGVLPLFHAFAQVANLLLPFAVGARVVFLETLSSADLVRALAERQITIVACVPQFLDLIHERMLSEVGRRGWVARHVFRAGLALNGALRAMSINIGRVAFAGVHRLLGRQVRLFVTGGSKFDPANGRDLYALGFTILHAYGLTETSGPVTMTRAHEAHLDTVGRAFPGHTIRILPPATADLDGEIAIRGPIVMQGYYNRPDATAAVLQDGWLLTGDLGRLDAEGRLTITGRKTDVIVLASGEHIHPEEVEAQYRRSPFIEDICVLGRPSPDEPAAERLFAVVVPNRELMRERRIANAGDLLRFEIEGQSVHLPPHQRILGYEVWFEPLPRTGTGNLKRHEIAARVARKRPPPLDAGASDAAPFDWGDDRHAQSVAASIASRAKRAHLSPDANLELDLGLDSLARVELLAALETRFGVRIDEAGAHAILTVGQLIEAVRPAGGGGDAGATPAGSWPALLRHLPPASDPALRLLRRTRTVVPLLLFLVLQAMRLVLPSVRCSGGSNLPADGPYIISPNHQSYLDPVFVCSVLPYRVLRQVFFVGATEYFETPVMAWVARQLNLVAVDPDANLVPAMRAGAFGLTHGRILVLFPEGERSIDGTVKRFKKGAAILARELGVPIVPVAVRGVFELWPRNRPFNWRLLRPWSGHVVRVAVGLPLRVEEQTSEIEAAATLRERVCELWDALARSSEDGPDRDGSPHAAHEKNA